MQINLLTSKVFPDSNICKECKHYKTAKAWGCNPETQLIDAFCIDCYSDKVFVITRFEKRTDQKENK